MMILPPTYMSGVQQNDGNWLSADGENGYQVVKPKSSRRTKLAEGAVTEKKQFGPMTAVGMQALVGDVRTEAVATKNIWDALSDDDEEEVRREEQTEVVKKVFSKRKSTKRKKKQKQQEAEGPTKDEIFAMCDFYLAGDGASKASQGGKGKSKGGSDDKGDEANGTEKGDGAGGMENDAGKDDNEDDDDKKKKTKIGDDETDDEDEDNDEKQARKRLKLNMEALKKIEKEDVYGYQAKFKPIRLVGTIPGIKEGNSLCKPDVYLPEHDEEYQPHHPVI